MRGLRGTLTSERSKAMTLTSPKIMLKTMPLLLNPLAEINNRPYLKENISGQRGMWSLDNSKATILVRATQIWLKIEVKPNLLRGRRKGELMIGSSLPMISVQDSIMDSVNSTQPKEAGRVNSRNQDRARVV